jgi:hypothetical protein
MLQINRLIGKVALLLLTFVVGVTSTLLFRLENSPPTAIDDLPPKVTLCQLAQNPEIYDGLTIRVEADADDFDGEPFIFDETCGSPRTSFGLRTMKGYWLADDRLRNLLAQADSNNSQVRVLLIGKFDANAKFTCFAWKFGIIMMNFELQPTKRTE